MTGACWWLCCMLVAVTATAPAKATSTPGLPSWGSLSKGQPRVPLIALLRHRSLVNLRLQHVCGRAVTSDARGSAHNSFPQECLLLKGACHHTFKKSIIGGFTCQLTLSATGTTHNAHNLSYPRLFLGSHHLLMVSVYLCAACAMQAWRACSTSSSSKHSRTVLDKAASLS